MIKINELWVGGWEAAFRGMRNPLNSHKKADSYFPAGDTPIVGGNDMDLAMRLAKAGSEHGKYLRMIHVSMDITAPVYWWREMDTYKVATTANSTSMMHKGMSRHYTPDDFSCENLCPKLIEGVCEQLNRYIDEYKETGSNIDFMALRQLMPMGYNYTETWDANYAVLRTIYHQRRHHRLPEWQEFCDFIGTLPYSELITEE